MRYFFHVASGHTLYRDDVGEEFLDIRSAKAYALRIARELAGDGDWTSGSLLIIEENGKEIDRLMIAGGPEPRPAAASSRRG